MALENKLAQLQAIEVGSVEKAIEEIERNKLAHGDVSRAYDQELMAYCDLMGERLHRIINNIYLLGNQISELEDRAYSFYPIEVAGGTKRISLHKDASDNTLGLGIEDFMKNLTWIIFEKDFAPRGIAFSTYGWVHKRGKLDHQEHILKFRDKGVAGFVDQFMSLLADYHRNPPDIGRDNDLDSLPFVLNMVPSLLSRIYEEKRQGQEKKLNGLQKRNGNLTSLNVSDII